MSIAISKLPVGLLFATTGTSVQDIKYFPFGTITNIEKKVSPQSKKVVIKYLDFSSLMTYKYYEFDYADVVAPVTASIDALITKLTSYLIPYVEPEVFTAKTGQSTYTVLTPISALGKYSILVVVDGVVIDNSRYSLASGVITFSDAFLGGEYVMIYVNTSI